MQLRAIAIKEGADPAVVTTFLVRVTTSFVPFISVLIVVRFLTVEQQGFWYLFTSLLAIAGNAELGFGQILSRLCAIEWGRRAEGHGDSAVRLQNLFKVSLVFGLTFGLVAAVGTGFAGYYWISTRPAVQSAHIDWKLTWWLSSVAGPLLIALSMVNSFFEGCQLIATVNVRRFVMSWAGLVGSAGVFLMGGNLLGFAGSRLLPFAVGVAMIGVQHRELISSLGDWWSAEKLVSWSGDIWPLQWRYALSWSSGILINALYVPVVFNYLGPADGGRFGLSMSILTFIFMTTTMLAGAKSPRLAMLFGQRKFAEMRHELKNMCLLTLATFVVLAMGLVAVVVALQSTHSNFANRLVPLPLIVLGLLGVLGNAVFTLSSTFARSLRGEPFVALSIVQGLLTLGLAFWATRSFGVAGTLLVYSSLWVAAGAWAVTIARSKWAAVTAGGGRAA